MIKNIHIITLAGDIASGKGLVSNILKNILGYTVYRNGEYFRSLAKERNMSILDFNKYVENHREIDLEIENSAKIYAEKNDNLIIDARLGWFAIPHSFKVYLKVDIDESARRMINDMDRGEVEKYSDFDHAKKDISERFILENERWFDLYKVRKDDMRNYDLVVDTTNILPEEVAETILSQYYIWLTKQK